QNEPDNPDEYAFFWYWCGVYRGVRHFGGITIPGSTEGLLEDQRVLSDENLLVGPVDDTSGVREFPEIFLVILVDVIDIIRQLLTSEPAFFHTDEKDRKGVLRVKKELRGLHEVDPKDLTGFLVVLFPCKLDIPHADIRVVLLRLEVFLRTVLTDGLHRSGSLVVGS